MSTDSSGKRRHPTTVAVVGAGHVGAAVATTLLLLQTADSIIVFDRSLDRAEGEVWDLADAVPLLHDVEIVATDRWEDLAATDIVVIAAGIPTRPGQSRLDVNNADVIRAIMARLDAMAPDAVVLIVTNPVDVLTRLAQNSSSRPWRLIIGAGTVLDTARLRRGLAATLGVDPHNTHVHVLGEHGDSSFIAWSSATIGPVPLTSFPVPLDTNLAAFQEASMARTLRRGPVGILSRKGYTSAGIAAAVNRIVECVLRDQRGILTVSTRALPEYGIGEEAVMGLPCVVGREGVLSRLRLALDDREEQMLRRSAAILDEVYRQLPPATTPMREAGDIRPALRPSTL
jgi:L-lactate dehydrogenase